MLDIKFIKENQEAVREAIRLKNINLDLNELLRWERTVVEYKKKIERLQAEKNLNANKVSKASPDERKFLISRGREIAADIEEIKPKLDEAAEKLQTYLLLVPNIPHEGAPIGENGTFNVEIKVWGEARKFDFPILNHVELLEKHHWIESERVGRISGSRTYILKNEMVLMEIALIQFVLKKAQAEGFQLLSLPSLVKEETLYGTGHFPEGRDQVYFLPVENLYLAGTAEVPINALHSKEILDERNLPLLYAGFSPCFRREAGSAGRDVRGLIRVHQFYKVELFVLCKNKVEESLFWLKKLLQIAEEIVQALELPYRVVECCTGDMGVGKVKMFDIETWVPSESKYRETHSCSSFYDWQARRSNLRYRTTNGEVKFCHTLNNTAIATPRILVPLVENHQQRDTTIYIPPVLRGFFENQSYLPVPPKV